MVLLIETLSRSLSTSPSFTINPTTYVPSISVTKVDVTDAASANDDVLPSGTDVNDHA